LTSGQTRGGRNEKHFSGLRQKSQEKHSADPRLAALPGHQCAQQRLAVLLAFSASFATIDWIMSLEPSFWSSVFMMVAGASWFNTGLALILLVIALSAARILSRPGWVEPKPGAINLAIQYMAMRAFQSSRPTRRGQQIEGCRFQM
jgi:hypothetical protein